MSHQVFPSQSTGQVQATLNTGPFALALLLAGLAGWVDAAGLSGTGRMFVSFMSGNTTTAGLAVAHQDWARVGQIGAVLGCFVGGVTVGEILNIAAQRWSTALVLLAEAIVLGAGAAVRLIPPDPLWIEALPLTFGMGLQNAAMHSAGGVNVGLTYITGTLVRFGRLLAGLLRGGGDAGKAARYLGLWFSLGAGAVLSGLALAWSRPVALAIGALLCLCLSGVAAMLVGQQRPVRP